MFEDRAKLWPGKPGKADAYPWRFPAEPELVLDEDDWLPAEAVKDRSSGPQVAGRALEARVPGAAADVGERTRRC